jgi:F-type H+-transporting ATPase subunit delta
VLRGGKTHAIRRLASGAGVFGDLWRTRSFPRAFKPLSRIQRRLYPALSDDGRSRPVADDSKQTDVGVRYAQALFELAKEKGEAAAVEADLKGLKAMWTESRDLRVLIASPAFAADEKGRGLTAIADAAGLRQTTRKFLGLVAANRRASALPAMIAAYEAIAAKDRGAVSAEVVTAAPLSAAQSQALAAALRTALGKDPELETRVDPAILGGLKVRIGSRLFDASVKSRLDSLKFALKRA